MQTLLVKSLCWGSELFFPRLSGEQRPNLSSYRNAEWINQQRGSQREQFYVKAQKCKKSSYRSGGHSHNSVEKKEGNSFIKSRSDNFKNIFLLLQTLPSSLQLLSLCQSQWWVSFSLFRQNCCLHPILLIVGKSIWKSTDKNSEQKIAQNQKALWQNCFTRCTIHVAMCLKDKFLDQCYFSTWEHKHSRAGFAHTEAKY